MEKALFITGLKYHSRAPNAGILPLPPLFIPSFGAQDLEVQCSFGINDDKKLKTVVVNS
jgi:hypothetical protein